MKQVLRGVVAETSKPSDSGDIWCSKSLITEPELEMFVLGVNIIGVAAPVSIVSAPHQLHSQDSFLCQVEDHCYHNLTLL